VYVRSVLIICGYIGVANAIALKGEREAVIGLVSFSTKT